MGPKKRQSQPQKSSSVSTQPPSSSESDPNQAPRRRNGGEQRPGFSFVQLGLMFGLLLVANYYGVTWFKQWMRETDSESGATTSSTMYQVLGGVTVRELTSPNARFADDCAKAGVPVVLRNSVVEKWRARRQWNPKYIQSHTSHITGAYVNDNRWFGPYYDSYKPLTHIFERTNKYRTDVNMTSKRFFKKLRQPSEREFLYFTGDIDRLGDWAIDDIQPFTELLALNPQRSSVNVWMGQPHVIAHCHYDGYHNFFAQLYGSKKFTLFQPDNWPGLYPYPFLHPSHAQTQVNLSNTLDIDSFPLAESVRALEVVLQPGDLLYMPPLWFHLVESMDVSISVNVWTDSHQTAVMEEVFSLPLPTESNGSQWNSKQQKAIATSVMIHTLLHNVCQRRDCRRVKNDRFLDNQSLKALEGEFYFVYQLWSTRYRTLMEREHLPNGIDDDDRGYSMNETPILCEGMTREESKVQFDAATSALDELGLQQYMTEAVENINRLPQDTWELWVGNYVEYLAATAVDVELVGAFLRHYGSCLLH